MAPFAFANSGCMRQYRASTATLVATTATPKMPQTWALPKLSSAPSRDTLPRRHFPEVSEYHLVIRDPQSSQVLVNVGKSSGCLPCLIAEKDGFRYVHEVSDYFLAQIKGAFHISYCLTILSCATHKQSEVDRYGNCVVQAVVVLEAHGHNLTAPVGMAWMELRDVHLPSNIVNVKDAADLYHRIDNLDSAKHFPHAQRGWFEKCVAWIETEFQKNDISPISHVEQLCCTWRGCVLRITTVGGTIYYAKCCPKFTKEIEFYRALLQLVPEYVAVPLAISWEKRVILTPDIGPVLATSELARGEESETWCEELFQIHRKTIYDDHPVLQQEAFLHVRIGSLPLELDAILRNISDYFDDDVGDIVSSIHSRMKEVENDCALLESMHIPDTFVHADLLASNVFRRENKPTGHGMIDFAESVITHPFFECSAARKHYLYIEKWANVTESPDDLDFAKKHPNLFLSTCSRLAAVVGPIRLWNWLQSTKPFYPVELPSALKGSLEAVKLQYDYAHDDLG